MRLLAFLSSLEASLRSQGHLSGVENPPRHVDYTRGLARMSIDAEHTLTVTHFRLASGRTCVRAALETEDGSQPVQSLYPESEGFSWEQARDAVVASLLPLLEPEETVSERSANVVNA